MNTLQSRDQNVVWHPYSQHGLNRAILPVHSGYGAYLQLEDGRQILDAISSWWVNIHGHSHPAIVEAIQKQAGTLEHVIFSGFTHEPAVSLAEKLVNYPVFSERGLKRVFYSDNGSTAVEVALKMAYQFHCNRGSKTRQRFIALSHSYHGDTLGAMAVSEPEGYHLFFRPILTAVDFIEPGNLKQLEKLLDEMPNQHAAFIFEPLIQGAGGMKIYDREFLEQACQLCHERGILIIADEVFTGFYRTGKCFAIEHTEVRPDLVCLSKGITGGFLPLAVTLASEEIFSGFLSSEIRSAFLHGHSYTANPISCAAALASWEILHSKENQTQVQLIADQTLHQIQKLAQLPRVKSARSLGTIGAIELNDPTSYFSSQSHGLFKSQDFYSYALERGVLLRPLGNVIYAVPPYCCTAIEIQKIYDVMNDYLNSF